MARNGAGTYERAVADYVYNTTIDQTTVNQEMDDIASALTGSLAKNGETVPTANLPMGTYRHTGVGNGSARTDYAALGQVQDGNSNWVDGGGTADAITATYSPVITALVDGQMCYVRATAANATTTPTFSPNGLTARTIVKNGGVALAVGDIVGNGHELALRYDLTNLRWELLNPNVVLSGYQPLDAQLTTLAGITAQQATDLAAVSTFMGTVLNDADAATARATLGAAPATTYIESDLAAASKIALTSAAAANITSISLIAGEWDVSGVVVFDPAGTTSVTVKRGSISLTSAAIDTTLGRFFGHGGAASVDAGNASSYASKIVRLSLGATTTVYLVASSTFTVDAMSAYGNISARKVA